MSIFVYARENIELWDMVWGEAGGGASNAALAGQPPYVYTRTHVYMRAHTHTKS